MILCQPEANLIAINTKKQTSKQTFRVAPLKKMSFKDTHREKALSNKTPALTKNMNMYIWLVGISN